MVRQPLVRRELLDPVISYFRPRQVMLFGSAARGEAGPDSDFDLLVILDDDAPHGDAPWDKLTLAAGFEARRTYKRGANVIPCRASTFADRAPIAGTLAHEAATDGVIVYERPAA